MNFDNQKLQFLSKFTALEIQSIPEIKNTSSSENEGPQRQCL
jgi:hypothetical protein